MAFRAFLVLLFVPTPGLALPMSGIALLSRTEKQSADTSLAVAVDGTIAASASSVLMDGEFEVMKNTRFMKLVSAIGVDITPLLEEVSERFDTMPNSELLAVARNFDVEQNELDLAADAKDMRGSIVQLILKAASEGNTNDKDVAEADEGDANDEEGRRRRRRRRRRRKDNSGDSGDSAECETKRAQCEDQRQACYGTVTHSDSDIGCARLRWQPGAPVNYDNWEEYDDCLAKCRSEADRCKGDC
jgi:hypothetical protein